MAATVDDTEKDGAYSPRSHAWMVSSGGTVTASVGLDNGGESLDHQSFSPQLSVRFISQLYRLWSSLWTKSLIQGRS